MKLKELKDWLETLPKELDEYQVVNAEEGVLDEDEHLTYRLDKPIILATVNEETKEILFLNKDRNS